MSLTAEQKQAIREMVKRNGSDAYADQVGSSEDFALSELASFKKLRLSELAIDQSIHDTSFALYNSI